MSKTTTATQVAPVSHTAAVDEAGGGIASRGELIAANATIVANRSNADGPNGGSGGGLHNGGIARLKNMIVAGNRVGSGATTNDIAGSNLQGSSYNLVSDAGSPGGLVHGVNGNIVGNNGVGVLTLETLLNPTLAANGGPMMTHALAAGSPAIDGGHNDLARDIDGIPFTNDQRGFGFRRIEDGTVDIGAFES